MIPEGSDFEHELVQLINKYSIENHSNTPDFILANYIKTCLNAFSKATMAREAWFGRVPKKVEPSHPRCPRCQKEWEKAQAEYEAGGSPPSPPITCRHNT